MKILDRYVTKQFIIGYGIALMVTLGMFITLDLFLNLDEWAELADKAEAAEMGAGNVLLSIFIYYGAHALLWFRDMAGVITVIAAVFSLARMTKNNELIAVMASGRSLKRFIAPIIVLAGLLTGLQVMIQEMIIPRLVQQLVRSHDEVIGTKSYDLWFAADSNENLISTFRFNEKTQTMENPFFILRQHITGTDRMAVVGRIKARQATYDASRGGWALTEGQLLRIPDTRGAIAAGPQTAVVDFIASDLTPQQIPIRRQEGYKSLLSSAQLMHLASSKGTRQNDLAELYLQRHSRITDPIMNLVILLVALPVLVCRDPRDMKTAILISFATSTGCFVLTFICKMFATEVFFNQVRPELWAWAPIFIFVPIAFIQLDSMKT
jgi:lipopolysaccharide export system permease protein